MLGPRVGIFVDYESPLTRQVAGRIWSGRFAEALDAGDTKTVALWESLRGPRSTQKLKGLGIHVFVGQDRPEAVEAVHSVGDPDTSHLCGVVVAVPDRPSPLAGSLLYQGVEQLTEGGVKVGAVEPALLHAFPKECEYYARRLLERLREV